MASLRFAIARNDSTLHGFKSACPAQNPASGSEDLARGVTRNRPTDYEAFFEQEVRTLAAAFSVMVAVA